MKRRKMSKQVVGYSIVGAMLLALSAPDLGKGLALTHVHHPAQTYHHKSVPTLAPGSAESILPTEPGAQLLAVGPSTPGGSVAPKPSEVQPPGPPTTPRSERPPSPSPNQPPGPADSAAPPPTPTNLQPLYRLGKLRIHVIDGRTTKPLSGAEVVLIETEQRLTTDKDGYTGWFEAPIIRNPRYRPLIQELHGQLGVVVYKNGYRDSVHLGIRIHDEAPAQATVWMYKIGPGDTRIEPVLYEEPYHHLWLIDLADRFRSKSQLGEGFQHP